MSIQSELTRLTTAKNGIKSALENQGVTVGNVTIDSYPTLVTDLTDQIETALDNILGEVI